MDRDEFPRRSADAAAASRTTGDSELVLLSDAVRSSVGGIPRPGLPDVEVEADVEVEEDPGTAGGAAAGAGVGAT